MGVECRSYAENRKQNAVIDGNAEIIALNFESGANQAVFDLNTARGKFVQRNCSPFS